MLHLCHQWWFCLRQAVQTDPPPLGLFLQSQGLSYRPVLLLELMGSHKSMVRCWETQESPSQVSCC